MKEFKGTKGNWKASNSGHYNFDLCIIAEDGGSVCFITNWTDKDANAKLISSAPELLKSLQHLLVHYEGQKRGDAVNLEMEEEMIKKAKESIKKALG